MTALKAASVAVTLVTLGGALSIGGGIPLSPARIAAATNEAAENSAAAADNTDRAAESTRALATISRNVQSQVDTSRLLLETQTKLKASSQRGAARSKDIARGVSDIRKALDALARRVEKLTEFSGGAASTAQRSAGAAGRLAGTLRALRLRFDEVVKQSRRLNRKARGYEEARDGPG